MLCLVSMIRSVNKCIGKEMVYAVSVSAKKPRVYLLSVTNGKLLKTFASPQQLFVHRFNNPSKTRSSSKTYQTQPSILQVYLACCSCCICSTVLCLTTSSLSFSISSFCLSISSFAFPFHMSFATK